VGVFEKPQPPIPTTAQKPAAKPAASPAVASAMRETARDLTEGALEKRPYLRMAFSNPYNLSLFGGMLAAAGLTLNPVLAVAACGLEALWLLHAPDNARLKHLLWDPKFAKIKEALDATDRAQRLQGVSADERARVETLVRKQREIRAQAGKNPSFTGELLKTELVKTDRLVGAFVDMTVTCARYHEYLESVDLNGLERDRRRYEAQVRNGKADDPETGLAKKNLGILLKRLDKMKEIRRYLTLALGQLDLIENSFQLIQDQIVTMQSPQELSGQLDELLDGVEAIQETTRDTEKILNSVGDV
jgi:hypothetical protein